MSWIGYCKYDKTAECDLRYLRFRDKSTDPSINLSFNWPALDIIKAVRAAVLMLCRFLIDRTTFWRYFLSSDCTWTCFKDIPKSFSLVSLRDNWHGLLKTDSSYSKSILELNFTYLTATLLLFQRSLVRTFTMVSRFNCLKKHWHRWKNVNQKHTSYSSCFLFHCSLEGRRSYVDTQKTINLLPDWYFNVFLWVIKIVIANKRDKREK